MNDLLVSLLRGHDLDPDGAHRFVDELVAGTLSEPVLAGILVALEAKGVVGTDLRFLVDALLRHARPFPGSRPVCLDTCGTGGDGSHTFNISTASALVLATMDIPVIKHGNRSVSSRCGSADVLEAAGVALDVDPAQARRTFEATGFVYLHAPIHHPGLGRAREVRTQLQIRTVFNRLGPLLNPARPRCQVVGVFHPSALRPMAEALAPATERALVVHGAGTDELAVHGPTRGYLVDRGRLEPFACHPGELGLGLEDLRDLRITGPAESLERLRGLLRGRGRRADRSAVALNAGAAAWLWGRARTLAEGVQRVQDMLDTDAPAQTLARLAACVEEVAHV